MTKLPGIQQTYKLAMICLSCARLSLLLLSAPIAAATPRPHVLSLNDAIVLALRHSPVIQTDQLQRTLDKMALRTAYHAFVPAYTLKMQSHHTPGLTSTYQVSPSLNWTSTVGGTLSVQYNNTLRGGGGTGTMSWQQELLRGFGADSRNTLLQADISAKKNQRAFKDGVVGVVMNVITQYRQLVQVNATIGIQKQFLNAAQKTLSQYRVRVKVGKMARSELLQQQASLQSTQLDWIRSKSQREQAYQSLLSTIGLAADVQLQIQNTLNVQHITLPTLSEAIQRTLAHNTDYQNMQLDLMAARAALHQARIARRPSLTLTASQQFGTPPGTSGPFFMKSNRTLDAALSIPINDISSRNAVVTATINIQKLQLAIAQKKAALIRQVTTLLEQINNDWAQIQLAQSTLALQARNIKATQMRLNNGLTTVFELNQAKATRLQEQTNLISAKITYQNDISTLRQLWDGILDQWHIHLKD